MTFTTLTFGLFLVLVFALHWCARGRVGQNSVILVASYLFYGWWDLRFCSLLLGSSLLDYAIARAIARSQPQPALARQRRALFAVSCVANLGLLAVFKYFDFFIDSLALALDQVGVSAELPSLRLILPVGISFYTFQTLGYTIDVYRGDVRASRSLLDYLAYVSFFPQLVAACSSRRRRSSRGSSNARSAGTGSARPRSLWDVPSDNGRDRARARTHSPHRPRPRIATPSACRSKSPT